ncbi:MAG: ABC-F family ATP-binding cassette domain-containing protein [Desulfobacterales bacterium]|nr:ABC-F family ATP-binding cassette domain-containing protein [Desulfobacterales bacterium]
MLSIENIHKAYGQYKLFDGVSFRLNTREKIGLVGRNGHGKTTLMRLIVGQEDADAGSVVRPRNYRIGYVQQHLAFTQPTILAEAITGLPAHEADQHWKAERILAGLGFSDDAMQRTPAEFSGGYQVRLNLAKVLISEPDLLLLDEPTNYLDITSIRWVVRFLRDWPREVLLITHDRSFMDQVVTHVVGLHRRKARKIEGDTAKYYDQVAQDEEIYEKTRQNDERRRKEIELFISRFRAKARLANLVQSRVKTLDKMEKKDRLEAIRSLDFAFRDHPYRGRQMMVVDDLAFGYTEGQNLFRNLSFSVSKGDRIGIIGRNGQGKTTLLKVLAGDLAPVAGTTRFNPNVRLGIYEQTHTTRLVAERTVEEEIMSANGDLDRQVARSICGAMMFSDDAALKKIQVLSGGEKSRVLLGQLLARPLNLLLLDEPSNHLDMESCDALLAAIDQFEGAVILVTHNEMFLHAVARRLIVFQGDQAVVFEGSYQRFLESGGWYLEEEIAKPGGGKTSPVRSSKKQSRRERSQILTRKNRALRPLEKEMAEIEGVIDTCEQRLHSLHADMQKATARRDGQQIAKLARAIKECDQTIETGFERLDGLNTELEATKARYDAQLAQIEMA